MSFKYYNEELGAWVAYTSTYATGIRIIDTDGNFIDTDTNYRSRTVEDALKLVARRMAVLEERVEYIYENGTLGGGGSGSVLPTLKLISPFSDSESQDYAAVSISSDSKVVVEYTFQSPNIGVGTAYVSITGDKTYKEVVTQLSQGMNKFDFGAFSTGSYKLNIYVVDAGGLYSNTLTVVVEAGSLEISSNFNDAFDFTLADSISINYTVKTISALPIIMTFSIDGVVTSRELDKGGAYIWSVGRMQTTGVHKLSMKATSGTFTSNELSYNVIVGDAESMFIASDFTDTQILEGRDIVIRYRASMAGETKAIIKKWINGVPEPSDTVMIGTGNYLFWKIGDQLTSGPYVFEMQAFTTDEKVWSEKLRFDVEVVTQTFNRIKPIMDDTLVASYIADTKSSASETRNVWEDRSGNDVPCILYDFNHVTNGWDGYSLNLDGRSYAMIDLAPWLNNCSNGFTFDIYYKVQNIGDIDAKVLWMKNSDTPYQGFYIDTQRANITSGNGKIIETFMRDSEKEDIWQHVTFVVNRKTQLMEIFVNSVISKVVRLSQSESFTFNGKIYLGGRFDGKTINDQGKSSIRSINIYNRTLEDEEILQNYISCLPYPDEQESVYRLNYDDQQIPKMDISGNLNGMTDDEDSAPTVIIDYMDYTDKTKSFTLSQCKISIQGTSSQLYPVKNYTIKLRANGQDFLYAPKDDWIEESRFTLKANYMDQSNANNICNARFFNDMIRAYHPYPSQVIDTKCRGTVDGFPIALYINQEYQGLYTFNIDRYANKTLGFDKTGSCVAYEVSANTNSGSGAFIIADNEIDTWTSIKREFKYRYHFAGDQEIVCEKDASMGNQTVLKAGSYHEQLVDLIYWTSESSSEEFRGEISSHWSLNHLIDYFTFVYLVGLIDNFGKNFVIACYAKDVNLNSVFYPLLYDADSCLGLTNDGFLTKGPEIDLDTRDFNTVESRLWSKLIDKDRGFWSEIISRYSQLRNEGWYTVDRLLSYYNTNFIGKIGQRFYNQDARLKYTNDDNISFSYLVHGHRLEYTKKWLEERLKYLDSVFEYYTAFESKAIIRTNVNDYLTLKIKSKSPRYIKVKWSDKLNYQKYFIGSDQFYEIKSPEVITNTDNNLDMLGVEDIVEIETFEHLSPSALHLTGMKNLTRLDAPNSTKLTEVLLETNKMLQVVNLKDCTKLGLNTLGQPTGNLNVIYCSNLKYLDVSGTSLASLNIIDIDLTNPDASQAIGTGALEFFDASETSITDVTLWNQTYLDEIKVADCYQLATINIGNCERLHTLSLPNSKINTFTIVDCNSLLNIDISNTSKLINLRLDGCPNLEVLNMSGVNSPQLINLDLSTVPVLKDLNISRCSFIEGVTFAEGFNTLKAFNLENSVLTSTRYGKRTDFPDYIDLTPLSLTSINFKNCPSVREVRGLSYVGGGDDLFYNCQSLETIKGTITIAANKTIHRMFYACTNLTNLPTLNLANATSGSETFMSCKTLTLANARTIMNSLGSAFKSSYRFFKNCKGIIGTLPSNFFTKTPNLETLNEFFLSCEGITGAIPETFFAPLGSRLKNIRYAFGGTTISGDVNQNWFSTNTNLEECERAFNGCKELTGVITAVLFENNTNLKGLEYMFNGCTGIQTRIPERLFSNHRKLEKVSGLFCGCTGLYGNIPAELFKTTNLENYNITSIKSIFEGCTGLYGQLDGNFLYYLPSLQNADAVFKGTDIYGTIPETLFSQNRILSTASGFFQNCTSLEGPIPKGLLQGLDKLSTISSFFDGCTNLVSEIPTEFLLGCSTLRYFGSTFKGCTKLYGSIPEDLFEYSSDIESISYLFDECTNLSSSIPANLFSKCRKVQDMSYVFRRAYRLTGAIPDTLLHGCIALINAKGMFSDCRGLGNQYVDEDDPYFIHPDFFIDCPNLSDVSSMFYMWGGDVEVGGTKLKGEIPERLFEPCANLKTATLLFAGCGVLKGPLSPYMFARCKQLKDINYAFGGCSGLTLLPDGMFTNNTNLTDVGRLFDGCSGLKGNSFKFWEGDYPKITSSGRCYAGCTNLSDYETIPSTWK